MKQANILLVVATVLLATLPVVLVHGPDARFGATDKEATDVIRELRPDYQPWMRSLWQPPGAEIESLLFALQAALGAGVLGFYLGMRRGEARARQQAGDDALR
jgi:cobalt/nickel transport protein